MIKRFAKSKVAATEAGSLSDEVDQLRKELAHYKTAFAEIDDVTTRAGRGDLGVRVVNWDQFDSLSPAMANINKMLDLADFLSGNRTPPWPMLEKGCFTGVTSSAVC